MKSFYTKNPIKKLVLTHNTKEHQQNLNKWRQTDKLPSFNLTLNSQTQQIQPYKTFSSVLHELPISTKQSSSFLTVSNSKRNLSLHENVKIPKPKNGFSADKISRQTPLQNDKLLRVGSEQKTFAKKMTEQLINQLRKQSFVHNLHMSLYSIKRVDFQDIIQCLLSTLVTKQNKIIHYKASWAHILQNITNKILLFVHQLTLRQRQGYLKRAKQFSITVYSHKKYEQEIKESANQLEIIKKVRQQNSEEIKRQVEAIRTYDKQIEQKMTKIVHQTNEQLILSDHIKQLQQTKNDITNQTKQFIHILQQTKTASQKITNFVNQQNNKILIMVSEQYKETEAEIYQYASKLQINQLASQMDYEPRPFSQIELLHLQQMKRVNKAIIQADHLDTQAKNKMMRDFVLSTINKFKKKDEEMTKVLNFKTKCIRTYIENMKKFLGNWEIKQEYLVNLRNQFSIDSTKMNQCLNILADSIGDCEECKQKSGDKLNTACQLYKKIELNYKMGNLFY